MKRYKIRFEEIRFCTSTSVVLLLFALQAAAAPTIPTCRVVSGTAGAPAIIIDGKPNAPLMFAANNQFNRDDVLLKEIAQSAEAGFNLFSFQVPLDWDGPSDEAAATIDKFCAANPNGYFYIRIWLGASKSWLDAHPEACIVKADGTRMDWVSPASEAWRKDTAKLLTDRLKQIISGPHGSHFLGVCLTNMQTGEWFYWDTDSFMDYSPANLDAFGNWLKLRYKSVAALREAWASPSASFDKFDFPSPADRDNRSWGPFRDATAQRRSMDMQSFQSDLVAETIAYFAGVAKRATARRSLVGAFYGYTFELNNNGPRALAQSGHLALSKLLNCPDIDMIHAPYTYFERKSGAPMHFHLPVDSLALHGKLAVLEDDTFTHRAMQPSADAVAPGWNDRTKDIDETLSVARRNLGAFFTHRSGFWYFDQLSDARWSDDAFWESAALTRRLCAELRTLPAFQPEVAFIVDEDSVHVMRASTHPYLLQSLGMWRAELDRIGTPVGYYLQSDLPKLPLSVKLLILANPYILREPERQAIDRVLARNGTVVWTYAPDVWGPNGADPKRIASITELPVEAKESPVPAQLESVVTNEKFSLGDQPWGLRFIISDARNAQTLAKYSDSGDVAAAALPMKGGVSVYTAVPRLPVGLLRWICDKSDVHIYSKQAGMVGIFGDYFVFHAEAGGECQFTWRSKCKLVERVAPSSNFPVGIDSDTWTDLIPPGGTAIYRCIPSAVKTGAQPK